MKRIVLFLMTNFAIMMVLSISLKVLGVEPYLTANGLNYQSLLITCFVFGFGGAFISLALSKMMAKSAMGVHVIEEASNPTERWLVATVQKYAEQSGIKMPEVGIFESPEPNAFATGMSKNSSLVAVSSGLLQHMSREEAEAVLGHEVAHAANGDMVTLALIQGVVNTFVMFLSRVIGSLVDNLLRQRNNDNSHGPGIGFYVAMFVSEMVLGLLASLIVMWFSRRREFVADRGGAKLAGRRNMISALEKLKAIQEQHQPQGLPNSIAAFGISGGKSWMSLFTTHPPLEDRINALKNMELSDAVRRS